MAGPARFNVTKNICESHNLSIHDMDGADDRFKLDGSGAIASGH